MKFIYKELLPTLKGKYRYLVKLYRQQNKKLKPHGCFDAVIMSNFLSLDLVKFYKSFNELFRNAQNYI